MDIRELLGNKIVFFDGGTGTLLLEKGLKSGMLPEIWNIENPEALKDIHKRYFKAGADIVMANTFGANRIKLHDSPYSVEELVYAGVKNAKASGNGAVALDVGPTGKLLAPLGDLDFEDAYDAFREMMVAGERAGADLIHIETMSDTYELKAAVLAAKENTTLPVFATVVFDEKGNLLTGGDIECVVALLEGLGVDALGINCGLGPIQMIELVKEMIDCASIPVIVNPNAGLPRAENGKTVYDVSVDEFAKVMHEMVEMGVWGIGGCCGTTPEHIALMVELCRDAIPKPIISKQYTMVTSYARAVKIGDSPVIIGERINPTGKSRFKEALRNQDIDYILREGLSQQENGAHILDVNVGLPDIDEVAMMQRVMLELQSIIDLPLQIDTSSIPAMESALRRYNGKAMINSVNGKRESMDEVFPLVKKYGGVVVGLTLDESGIPDTAEGRYEIAQKIVNTAETYGIKRKDIVIDVLCMTISSDPKGAMTTLQALQLVKEKLGVKTILGVSNISFGLPQRENINANFYTMALQKGLDAAIINPNAEGMLRSFYSYRALAGIDYNCSDYIAKYAVSSEVPTFNNETKMPLRQTIEHGMKELAHAAAKELLKDEKPLDIIQNYLIPALDKVGQGFERGTIFLPQLLMSAEAAKLAFEAIRLAMQETGDVPVKKGKIILATVKGDIHDIGKNIVKVLLENYSFDVIDLGKDVDPTVIVEVACKENVHLVGLSALMTTTVPSMEETIRILRKTKPDCKVMVGGAVLTQEYADMIGADSYSKDAMGAVHFAQKVLCTAENGNIV